jgi:hypothetical protein
MNTKNKKQNFDFPQYDMLTLCVEFATGNQATTDLILDFKTNINSVKSKLNLINILMADEKQNNTGTTIQKRELKYALADRMFEVSEPFSAYAAGKNNNEWYTAFSKSIWAYKHMRPSVLISQADKIIAVVTPLLPQLTGTTIVQSTLDAIQDARDAFSPFATKPRSKTVAKNDALTQMVTLLRDAMSITRRQLDRLSVGFITLNKQSYYNEWLRSRKLTPYGTLTTRASIDVFMGDANSPVQDALIKIDGTPLKGITDAQGHVTISRVPFKDPQNLTVTAPGFENPVHAGPYTFKKGKATHITLNMNEFSIPEPVSENTSVPSPQ